MMTLVETVKALAQEPQDYSELLDSVDGAHIVLLGEASHGTHEFYAERARITRMLIEHKGFNAVAVEADWPDAYRVNRYVKGLTDEHKADEALGDFTRFPQWMWRNSVVKEFVQWLHGYNSYKSRLEAKVGFYGIDLYSLFRSIEAVIQYLDKTDTDAARRARERYECFDHFNRDSQTYGMQASMGLKPDCEDEVVEQLVDLQRSAVQYLQRDGIVASDELFFAEQNARVVSNSEKYYRSMFHGRANSWNIRDEHMAETVEMLLKHLRKHNSEAKIVVWAHNSHLGDARATDQSRYGELNLGQLINQEHGDDVVSVGFSTYDGTVTAVSNWDEPAQHKRVRPGLAGSYEELFHEINVPQFIVSTGHPDLKKPRLQRAIGVIYRPDTERQSHYFMVDLPRQFDWIVHIDRSHAVEPLEKGNTWIPSADHEVPEAYPTGI